MRITTVRKLKNMPKNSTQHAGTNSLPASQDESDSETEDESGFRVHVDLSEYWGTAAACVCWVRRARGRRLRWLARRLRRAAALRRPFCLLLPAGAALAPRGPLRLLRRADTLRVVPVEHEWQKPFSFWEDDDEIESPGPRRNGDVSPSPETEQTEPEPPAPLSTPDRRNIESSSPGWTETSATVTGTSANVLDTEEAPASASPPVDGGGGEALQSVKRRALALLEAWGGAGGAGAGADEVEVDEADGAPPRRKRRRVRRRRKPDAAPVAAAEPPPHAAPAAPQPGAAPRAAAPDLDPVRDPTPTLSVHAFVEPPQDYQYTSPKSPPPGARAAAGAGPALVRNPAPPRPPRLVRPLPATPAPTPTTNTESAPRAVC